MTDLDIAQVEAAGLGTIIDTVSIDVLGTPSPKGSARAFIRGGRAVVAPGSSAVGAAKIRAWSTAVREAVLARIGHRAAPVFVGVALDVEILFRMARPAGHWGKRGLRPAAPPHPAGKPDIDKLARATIDALTGSVFDDDSRIVTLWCRKGYADPGREGASILVAPAGGAS